ncbi:MAG: SRPBCC domain-containing protein [Dehalococcoidia bacterium]
MITRDILLPCPPARAFEVFTERASEWWPASRRHTADPASTITISSEGEFSEAGGGQVVPLGRVLVWEPPTRLVLEFYPGTGPEHPTEATITFAQEGDGTRVRVDHRPTPRSQELWDLRAPRFEASWESVLAALAEATS